MTFTQKLRSMGHSSYGEYLNSEYWQLFRIRLAQSGVRMHCEVCDRQPVDIHHRTYARLGEESFDDVTPLCRTHHRAVHLWLKQMGYPIERTDEAVRHLVANRKPAPPPVNDVLRAVLQTEATAKGAAKRRKRAIAFQKFAPELERHYQNGLVDERKYLIAIREFDLCLAKSLIKQATGGSKSFATRIRRRAEFAALKPVLDALLAEKVIDANKYLLACNHTNVELANKLIKKGQQRKAKPPLKPKQPKPLPPPTPRVSEPFKPNDSAPVADTKTAWQDYLRTRRRPAR